MSQSSESLCWRKWSNQIFLTVLPSGFGVFNMSQCALFCCWEVNRNSISPMVICVLLHQSCPSWLCFYFYFFIVVPSKNMLMIVFFFSFWYKPYIQLVICIRLLIFFRNKLLLQSPVSHDPSEIILICWFAAQDTFLIIISIENS